MCLCLRQWHIMWFRESCKGKNTNKQIFLRENDCFNFFLLFFFIFQLIVPPSWIVKVPRKSSFKSSLKNSPNKKKFKKRANAHGHHHHHHHHHHTALPDTNGDILEDSTTTSDKNERPFCLKPIPSPGVGKNIHILGNTWKSNLG